MNNCYREHRLWVFLSVRSTIHAVVRACPPRHGQHIRKKGNQRNHIIILKHSLGVQIQANFLSADAVMLAYNGGTRALENTASAPCRVTEAFIGIVLSSRCMQNSYGWITLTFSCREFPCFGGFPRLSIS